MTVICIESIPITVGEEKDGRWWADIESMPGVMAYGTTREAAITAVRALALRVAADCLENGEDIPEAFTKLLSAGHKSQRKQDCGQRICRFPRERN